MKVLLQEWTTDQGRMVSISKDQQQLDGTIADLEANGRGEPSGEPCEVEVDGDGGPVSCALAEMVEGCTIFLNKDEEDAIIYPD